MERSDVRKARQQREGHESHPDPTVARLIDEAYWRGVVDARPELERLRERIGTLAEDMECPPWYRTEGHVAACLGCSKAIRVRALLNEEADQ